MQKGSNGCRWLFKLAGSEWPAGWASLRSSVRGWPVRLAAKRVLDGFGRRRRHDRSPTAHPSHPTEASRDDTVLSCLVKVAGCRRHAMRARLRVGDMRGQTARGFKACRLVFSSHVCPFLKGSVCRSVPPLRNPS